MRLFIRIVDGQPFEHPILEENFVLAFPDIDIDNLPPEFAEFIRIAPPSEIGVYQKYTGVTYEWENGKVKDVHHVQDMSQAEIEEKQNLAKSMWAQTGFASWLFNETTCSFEPPIPYPERQEGYVYRWNEAEIKWDIHTMEEMQNIIEQEQNGQS